MELMRIVLFLCLSLKAASYPLCVPLLWTEVDCSAYEAGDGNCNGFFDQTSISQCSNYCRSAEMNFCGVVRNGPLSRKAKCYCGDSVDGMVDGGTCSHICGGSPCGNSATRFMSVYPVCPPGKYGTDCELNCPEGYCMDLICDSKTGQCPGECIDDWYGDNCNTACSENCVQSCHKDNGFCKGCKAGFHGFYCNQACSENCVNGSCSIDSGHCSEGCKEGTFGHQCEPCPVNCDGVCNGESGACPSCQQGWFGIQCGNTCSPNCHENRCEFHNGNCSRCNSDAWFGGKCSQQCSLGCNNATCNQHEGNCLHGCKVGFYDASCSSQCPTNCLGACVEPDGSCLACKCGWTGNRCDQDLNECLDKPCTETAMVCYNTPGSYRCCRVNETFDNLTLSCQVRGKDDMTGYIVAGVIGVILVLENIAMGLIYWRRRKLPTEKGPNPKGPVYENMGDDVPMSVRNTRNSKINLSQDSRPGVIYEDPPNVVAQDYVNADYNSSMTDVQAYTSLDAEKKDRMQNPSVYDILSNANQ